MQESPEARALRNGTMEAEAVIERRTAALAERKSHLERLPPEPEALLAGVPEATAELLGPPARGVLVAEGDSWFDYPWADILSVLQDDYGYDVESGAHPGDHLEDMAYRSGQLEQFSRCLEKALRADRVPRAILLSGGGNDVTGDVLATLLNHARSPRPGLNDDIVKGLIERLRLAYLHLIRAVTGVTEGLVQQKVPIVLHGYDYPVPDGRGFLGGFWILPGPWLEPALRGKGYEGLDDNIRLLGEIIDRFNEMLATIPDRTDFEHVRYVDLRNTLRADLTEYRNWWADEMHPTGPGFRRIAKKLVDEF